MAEELRSAVRLALDPSTQEPLRSQARVYCEQLRASEDGWQLCLSLFLEADPKRYFIIICKIDPDAHRT